MFYPKINRIIEILEKVDNSPKSKLAFDIRVLYTLRDYTEHPCGTACCIAGHAEHATGEFNGVYTLAEFCNIPLAIASALAIPDDVDWDSITLEKAIACLKHCRDTGKVRWTKFADPIDLEINDDSWN